MLMLNNVNVDVCLVCYVDVDSSIPVAVFGHALPRMSSESVSPFSCFRLILYGKKICI